MALLETVLAPALGLVNRRLRQSTRGLDLAAELAGRTLAVRLNQSALALTFTVDPDGLRAVDPGGSDPDVIIEGSLPGLLRLAGGDPQAAIRDGDVTLTGDSALAERFQDLFRHARPDIGAELGRRLAAAEDLPTQDEMNVFAADVRELRDRVARLEATLARRADRDDP